MAWLLCRLRGEPAGAVFADQRDAFVDCVHAMWNGEIDLAGEFITFAEHRAATPVDELGPHFPDNNERGVVKFPYLEQLPRERQLQQSSDTAWNHHERIGDDHKMVQSRKERAVFVRLTDERVDLLLKG